VEAKVSGWTKYYPGEITRSNSDGTYDLKFEDGDRKSGVKKSQIKSKGSSPGFSPPLLSDSAYHSLHAKSGESARAARRGNTIYEAAIRSFNSDAKETKASICNLIGT